MNFQGIIPQIQRVASKNSPTILMTLGAASVVTAIGFAIKATPKAYLMQEEIKLDIMAIEQAGDNDGDPLIKTKFETIWYQAKKYAPLYWPTVVTGVAGIGFFLGANHIRVKRHEMLVAAYSLSEKALLNYQKKSIERHGFKSHLETVDEISRDKVNEVPFDQSTAIVTSAGETRCFDPFGGRYFFSDISIIRKAENEIIKRLGDEMFCTLNDFYEEVGLPGTRLGDSVGWDSNDIYPDFSYSSILDEFGNPCLVMDSPVGVLESKFHIL